MSKRKFEAVGGNFEQKVTRKYGRKNENVKKHSLDSDEEDDDDESNDVMHEDDIEGEEDGSADNNDGIRLTAFNMREELEEGHFDKQGHFIWKNEKEIRDNWLDNIDWQQIKTGVKVKKDDSVKGLADDSDSESDEHFDEIEHYKQLLKYMKPKETVNKTLRRLGGDVHKLSSVERLKRKKAGTLKTNEDVEKVTALADKLLTEMGNMDVYQETFEQISEKIQKRDKKEAGATDVLDMYADDFGLKEKEKLGEAGPSKPPDGEGDDKKPEDTLMWEFKWSKETNEIQGPFNTLQMFTWVQEGYFANGVMVRKCGENTNFYTSDRIDFDLYL